jgi:hypothetical protein
MNKWSNDDAFYKDREFGEAFKSLFFAGLIGICGQFG